MTARKAVRALPSGLLVVTDRHQAHRPLPEVAATLVASGVRWIWLRDRDLATEERRTLAEALADLMRPAGAFLSIGADVELAAQVGAAGVHLRASSEVAEARLRLGPDALLGVSTHSLADVRDAAAAGGHYVTLSPIFASASKPGYGPALGVRTLSEAAKLGIPVLALGGVTSANAAACGEAGAAGIAVMGPLMRADDPRTVVRELVRVPAERFGPDE